jgi:hypothetical protein
MNKFITLGLMVSFLTLMTVIANSVLMPVENAIDTTVPSEVSDSTSSILGYADVFVKLLTFQIPGMPGILTGLVFIPITFMVIFMIIDIVKDIIPFT